MLSSLFSDIATGLGSLVPSFFGALVEGFTTLFIVTTESGAFSALTPVGDVALFFIVLGIVYKIVPTIVGWLRMRARTGRKSRRKAR